ncbi:MULTISPECIES: BON domain-containing protein [unclassified Rhizobium]|uniref:BON domain-containing protein n=1 Tax=unclassified Rhizobium TaxID=2613769 RepID=UPI001ADB58FA|nr:MULTISPECIES: BON domain-containing protein [unclassified Rhizobium]MBO9098491.1 BON domain-containing protein [Rhizobium sp. L58/93]MBO9132705.1 BON domain-containing protein [Rhizobium sp. B209b/85]MBO9168757.1 BON domain-containing protein [Rhizobium sp. L245/93]MBO9184707.1 BON domain-containing protein [Rhizobium sp. E27B/91]QXZ84886.1 BON domain-containing protein [Rhizobium sp. K1/93]
MGGIKKDTTREEDYRDYEERDLKEGWPYDDDAGASSEPSENRPYGETDANFDEGSNKSFTVARTDADGQQERQSNPLTSTTRDLVESDDIEERVMDALSDVEGASPEMIDVRSEGTVIILEGEVDDAATARQLGRIARSISGVTAVRNLIQIIGVDANIPDDD